MCMKSPSALLTLLTNVSIFVIHKNSNETVLEAGDTVTLIKDLKVKGENLLPGKVQLFVVFL